LARTLEATGDDAEHVMCFIHGKVANKYEEGNVAIVRKSTVLHELVHWSRCKQKLFDPNDQNGAKIEVGKAFENEAYGGDVSLQTPDPAKP
jgi:Metallopeptidase toxin 3